MIILGLVLLLLGLLLFHPLVIIGIVLLVIGGVLYVTHAGGHRYY